MTSRERVRAVLEHCLPDRIPNAWGGCETAGLHVLAYDKLQKVLGLPSTPPRIDTFMTNAVFEEDVLQAMQGDIMLLASPGMCKAPLRGDGWEKQWKEQKLWGKTFRSPVKDSFLEREDGSVVWETCWNSVCPKGAFFFDSPSATDLLADFDVPDPDSYHPPMDLPEDKLREWEETAKKLYEETDYALCMGETITDLQIQPGGMIGSMILMKEEPEIMKEFLEKSVESALSQLRQLDQAIGKYVDILSIAHDFGDNRCVTIGDGLWREIYKPYYKKLFQGWKNTTSMKINLHSCGAIRNILGDLIKCGLEIYNPVQISGQGMDPAGLKEAFGKDLIFWGGGYDAQMFRPESTYEEVYAKTVEILNIFKSGGGYFFSGVHNLPADVPEHHLKAILDAFRSVREYV